MSGPRIAAAVLATLAATSASLLLGADTGHAAGGTAGPAPAHGFHPLWPFVLGAVVIIGLGVAAVVSHARSIHRPRKPRH